MFLDVKVIDLYKQLSWPYLDVLGIRISAINLSIGRARNRKKAEINLKDLHKVFHRKWSFAYMRNSLSTYTWYKTKLMGNFVLWFVCNKLT